MNPPDQRVCLRPCLVLQAAVEFGIVVRGEKGQNGGGGGGFQFSDLREFAMRGGLPFYVRLGW